MESILDNLPPSERSRFIRESIAEKLGQADRMRFYPTVPTLSQHKEVQSNGKKDKEPESQYKEAPYVDDDTPDIGKLEEPVFKEKESIDIEEKLEYLKNLYN